MTALFVFPHPDDETIFAGGTILRHFMGGERVVWICVSYGERGGMTQKRSPRIFYWLFALVGSFPVLLFLQKVAVYWLGVFRRQSAELIKIRKVEAEKVANILGIEEVIFWEIPDMRLRWYKKELVQKLKNQLEEIKPDIVYTLHPNGTTGHPDHVVLSDCITKAVNNLREKKPRLFYATFPKDLVEKYKLPLLGVPENIISQKNRLSPEELEMKREALSAYESQNYLWGIFLEKYPELLMEEYFVEMV